MKIIWTLHYHPDVTAFLYSVRGTEKADKVREAIKALQHRVDPTEDCKEAQGWPGRYEFEVAGHWVGIRVLADEKAVRVLYITIEA